MPHCAIVPPRLDVIQIVLDDVRCIFMLYLYLICALFVLCQVDLVSEGWLVREGYTFGMPRPGDAAFARTFDGMCLCSDLISSAFLLCSVHPTTSNNIDDSTTENISKQIKQWNLMFFTEHLISRFKDI